MTVAIVGRKRCRSASESLCPAGSVHNLVRDENARIRAHCGTDGGENCDTVIISPVVAAIEEVCQLPRKSAPWVQTTHRM